MEAPMASTRPAIARTARPRLFGRLIRWLRARAGQGALYRIAPTRKM
jgi:hypothetical protein